MLKILAVGHGLIGKQRAAALAALAKAGRCTLAGTVDPAPRDPALYGGAVPHYARFEDAPAASYDAAVIAVPHNLAAPISKAVLGQGKPILVEKPLGTDASEARAIIQAAEGVPLPSFVGYNYRFLPTFREAVARIARGELGKLRSVDMLLGHGGNPQSAEGWKLRPELAGGGVILDPGVHLFDLLLCLDPQLRLSDVAASRGFWKTGIEEDVVAVMKHADVLATVRVSHIRWVNTFRIEIGGDDGYLFIEGRGGSYGPQQARFGRRWGWNDGSGRSQRETEQLTDYGPRNDSLDIELGVVVERWTGGGAGPVDAPGPATLADGLRIAELCAEMYAKLA
jgi:1,5-anhydro-D-fructose reductase (1,5-anhydro-D-mannitol-forming)